MSTSPRVSVIITTYNRAALLLEALDSVLDQTYHDYELIVADDGSTDDTPREVAAFGDAVLYLRLAHDGRPSVVRNRAVEIAEGELIAFLDDDDRWLPQKLARQVALFDGASSPGFAFSDFRLFSDDTMSPPMLASWQKTSGDIFDALLCDCFILPSTVMVRRQLLEAVGGFDETFASAEDFDLWLRLAHVAPAGFVNAPLVLVRRHPGEISHRREETSARNVIRTLEQARAHFSLTAGRRIRLRRVLARRYTHLGLLLRAAAKSGEARQQFLRALRVNPLLGRAWLELSRTLPPPRYRR